MYTQNHGEYGYLDLLRQILNYGTDKGDRTGVGTRTLFAAQLHFDLNRGFPLIPTQHVFPRGVFAELAWLMRGETNIKSLLDENVHIWDEWADENGDLGPIYGKQWRAWEEWTLSHGIWDVRRVDQLQNALDLIQKDPNSRRIVVSAWNPMDLPRMALSPCHALYQFEVSNGRLNCHMYQRSADVFLGVPFNIASYAALTHALAHLSDLRVGELIVSFGDVHIYNNHFEQVREQLRRSPRTLPKLTISDELTSLDTVKTEHFILSDYDPHPAIKAEVAV